MEYGNALINRVLIADDEDTIHQDFEEILKPVSSSSTVDNLAQAFGSDEYETSFLPEFELLHARSGMEAYKIVESSVNENKPISIAYIDMRMPPGWDGVETTQRIRNIDKDIEIVIMTAYTNKPLSQIVRNVELLHKMLYIKKPFGRDEIQQITISLLKKWSVEKELEEKNHQLMHVEQMLRAQLKDALGRMLSGFLPICSGCKKVRDDDGTWEQIDAYIQKHTKTRFTYSICPECKKKLYFKIYESELLEEALQKGLL